MRGTWCRLHIPPAFQGRDGFERTREGDASRPRGGFDDGRDQPQGSLWEIQQPVLQGERGRDGLLQDAGQPPCRGAAFLPPGPATPGLRPAPHHPPLQPQPVHPRVGSDRFARQTPRGASSLSGFSSDFEEAVERAWTYATLLLNESSIRSGHIVVGMLKTKGLLRTLIAISGEFEKVKVEDLTDHWEKILGDSVEAGLAAKDGSKVGGGAVPGEASGAMSPAQMGKEEALKRFCKDLTEEARTGKIDPIVGRDEETRQVVDILMRRRQNNPVLVGEAGVGKTAVAEGFAHKIVEKDVPPPLQGVRLLELDVSALQAGASMKGEFEERLKQVIEEVQASSQPTILFIDEVHRLIGAGGAPARATRPSCSSPPSPGACCGPSPRRLGRSTRSTSRRTRHSHAGSRPCRSTSRTRNARSR